MKKTNNFGDETGRGVRAVTSGPGFLTGNRKNFDRVKCTVCGKLFSMFASKLPARPTCSKKCRNVLRGKS